MQGQAEKEVGHAQERVQHQQSQARDDQPPHGSTLAALQLRVALLGRVAGVTRVVESDRRERLAGFEIASETGRDVRRELARTVVSNGWGLLELRPMRMSLEEVFLSLTTDDAAAAAPAEGETANA